MSTHPSPAETMLSREDMLQVFKEGGSVLIHPYGVIARPQDLPSEAQLALGDRKREDAALAALRARVEQAEKDLAEAESAIHKARQEREKNLPPPPVTFPGKEQVVVPQQALQQAPLPPPALLPDEGLPADPGTGGPDGALAAVQAGPPAPAGEDSPQADATAAVSLPADPPGPTVPELVEEGLSPGADRAGADQAGATAGLAPETPAGRVGADQGGAGQDDTLSAAVALFVAESLDVGPELSESMDLTFERWVGWRAGHGLTPSTVQHFGRALRVAVPGLEETRPRTDDGGRERRYRGLALKAEAPANGEARSAPQNTSEACATW